SAEIESRSLGPRRAGEIGGQPRDGGARVDRRAARGKMKIVAGLVNESGIHVDLGLRRHATGGRGGKDSHATRGAVYEVVVDGARSREDQACGVDRVGYEVVEDVISD